MLFLSSGIPRKVELTVHRWSIDWAGDLVGWGSGEVRDPIPAFALSSDTIECNAMVALALLGGHCSRGE
jgi:hypothetical protein